MSGFQLACAIELCAIVAAVGVAGVIMMIVGAYMDLRSRRPRARYRR